VAVAKIVVTTEIRLLGVAERFLSSLLSDSLLLGI
jgi:hypothetical protein